MSRYAVTPLIAALSPGRRDITRFRPWSPIAIGNSFDRAKEIPKVAQTTGTVDVFDPRQAFRDRLREEPLHVQIFMNDGPTRSGEMSSCSAIDLAEIRRSSKIIS